MCSSDLDYAAVQRYWEDAGSQTAWSAAYMAHEQGLPDDCVRFRFAKESAVVDGWFSTLPAGSSVLDLGCGPGAWSLHFARRFERVVAVEQSLTMFEAARENLAGVANVALVNTNALSVDLSEQFDGVFLGGLLMYLNHEDAVALLRRLRAFLKPGACVVLRESTVRKGMEAKTGAYHVIYRSPAVYQALVRESGLQVVATELNAGYATMEIATELVNCLRSLPLLRSLDVSFLGKAVWTVLRATQPLSLRLLPTLLARLGVAWPHLQNHFFLLTDES